MYDPISQGETLSMFMVVPHKRLKATIGKQALGAIVPGHGLVAETVPVMIGSQFHIEILLTAGLFVLFKLFCRIVTMLGECPKLFTLTGKGYAPALDFHMGSVQAFSPVAENRQVIIIPLVATLLVLGVVTQEDFTPMSFGKGPGVSGFGHCVHNGPANIEDLHKPVEFFP
jgi:hypothetical protein